jgi:hypothetical protein
MHCFGLQVADARWFSNERMIQLSALNRTDRAASDLAEFGQLQPGGNSRISIDNTAGGRQALTA